MRPFTVSSLCFMKKRMRALYTTYFLGQARGVRLEGVHTSHGTPALAWTALIVDSYPDQYAPFYRLLSLFYEELLDNPLLLQDPDYRMNREVRRLIEGRYRIPY